MVRRRRLTSYPRSRELARRARRRHFPTSNRAQLSNAHLSSQSISKVFANMNVPIPLTKRKNPLARTFNSKKFGQRRTEPIASAKFSPKNYQLIQRSAKSFSLTLERLTKLGKKAIFGRKYRKTRQCSSSLLVTLRG